MGWLAKLKSIITDRGEGRNYPPEFVADFFGGKKTAAGVSVSAKSALGLSAVWNAVNVISNDVATLPLHLFRYTDDKRERMAKHPLERLLNEKPNVEVDAMPFRQAMMAHILLWGNGYVLKEKNGRGDVAELILLTPDRMRLSRDESGKLLYEYRPPKGGPWSFNADDIMHCRGLSHTGLVGYSVIGKARESLGLTVAARDYGAGFFGNDASPGGVLQYPAALSDQARTNLKRTWNEANRGPKNAHKMAILEEGMEWKQMSVPPEDAQFLETRKLGVTDIARWFNLPPHKLKDLERATFSNIENQARDYVDGSLLPWLIMLEQSFTNNLISQAERGSLQFKFVLEGKLRADTKTRYEAYKTAVANGWMTRNEVRLLENMEPLPGLDKMLVPLNMQVMHEDGTLEPLNQETDTVPAAEPVEDDEEQVEPDSGDDERVMTSAAIIEAHLPLLTSIHSRMLRKEAKAARKAAKKPDEFCDWRDRFYKRHGKQLAENTEPALMAAARLLAEARGDVAELDEKAIHGFAAEHEKAGIERRKAALLEVAGYSLPDALEANVKKRVSGWEANDDEAKRIAQQWLVDLDSRIEELAGDAVTATE